MIVFVVLLACLAAGCGASRKDPRDVFRDDRTVELARAVAAGDRARIAELVDRGAKVDASGTDGTTLIQWAVDTRSLAGLRALLDHGADPEQQGRAGEPAPYATAKWEPDAQYLRALLDAGADPDVRYDGTGETAIFGPAMQGFRDNVAVLLEAGADPNALDRQGEHSLFGPARTNQGAVLLMLLEAGADPRRRGPTGATFQDFYFSYGAGTLNDRSRSERRQIIEWLEAHDVAVVPEADQFR